MLSRYERRLNRIAYARPKPVPRAGKIIDAGSRIGTRIVQVVYFRPVAFGLREGKR